jgi:hypothetical protein
MTDIAQQRAARNSDDSRDRIPFHPLADIFPLMEGEEFDALVADIEANGLQQYIILCDGQVLDGRNRVRACLAAGWDPFAIREMCLNGDSWIDNPAAYVISVNIRRRHLTAEQKRDLIAAVLKAQPEKSNAAIAKQLGVTTDKTVATVRGELEGRSEIPNVETRTDIRGRKQPAKKGRASSKPELWPANYWIMRLVGFECDYANEFRDWLSKGPKLTKIDREELVDRLQSCAQDLVLLSQEVGDAATKPDDGLDIPEYLRRAL